MTAFLNYENSYEYNTFLSVSFGKFLKTILIRQSEVLKVQFSGSARKQAKKKLS